MICTYKLLTFILMPFCVWSKKIVTFIFKYNNGKILEPYMTLTKNDFQKGAESWYNLLTFVLMHFVCLIRIYFQHNLLFFQIWYVIGKFLNRPILELFDKKKSKGAESWYNLLRIQYNGVFLVSDQNLI